MTAAHSHPAPSGVTELAVSGLNCNNCARKVTGVIQGFPAVASVTIDLNQQRASIRWKPQSPPELPALLKALEAAGYRSRVVEAGGAQPSSLMGGWTLNLATGIPVTVALMLGEWVFRLGEARWFGWTGFVLAAVVQGVAGAKFYRGAWAQLKAGSSNMDTLVALGSTTAFGYSTWALLAGWPGHFYFMEAAAIITLISLGHWIEARVGEKAASSLKALMQLAPQTARRLSSVPGPTPAASSRAATPSSLMRMSFRSQDPEPRTAIETEVPVSELRIGDQLALRPGDRVPVDGEVLAGESAVDESMLTGESTPVDKTVKSALYAGTTNLNGRLIMRVTGTGEATALAHIITAVQRAQSSRANIQRLGDQVSNVFVPIVCALALGTALWWGLGYDSAKAAHNFLASWLWPAHLAETAVAAAFIGAAAVLIIACPCAMGLATPAAIMAAANTAARRGILIRDGVALEKAGAVTAVLFDKTGTLTAGKPVVANTWFKPGADEKQLSELAVALARGSTHPVSHAIACQPLPAPSATLPPSTLRSSATEDGSDGGKCSPTEGSRFDPLNRNADVSRQRLQDTNALPTEVGVPDGRGMERKRAKGTSHFTNWREVRGAGIEATVKTDNSATSVVRLGSLGWLRECGVARARNEDFTSEWSARGSTVVGLAAETELFGLFAVHDALKPGAAAVVRELQANGLKAFLITGDNPRTAAGIAGEVGIASDHVFAEVRPEQKADFVKRLQAQGEIVAFVGDGINDAPALEQADLGIAVSRASDVAREAADIILLKSDIEAVPESLGLARASLRTIKQNLFWAFFYNAAAIPLAVLGFMSPVLCAAAMGASDLIVIGNALRLRRWRRQPRACFTPAASSSSS